jgi:hypothetical protein
VRKCIWCLQTDLETTFNKKAHTIPQQLGGQNICENVCDKCNSYFGNSSDKLPAIETVLKETFNITRTFFLKIDNDIGKNKSMPKFSSIYFNIDLQRHKLSLKAKYRFHRHFQENIARQLKRGLYKIFLEERERQFKDGHDGRFDFIREFARYNIGDYPIYYFDRLYGIIPMTQEWARHPTLFLKKEYQSKYLVSDYGFFEFELLSHVFGLPITRTWELGVWNYLKSSKEKKKELFKSYKQIIKFNDIDLTLSIMGDKK